MRCALLLLTMLSAACVTMPRDVPAASSDARCQDLEGDYRLYGAIGVALSAFAVGGAAVTPAPKVDDVKWVVGISSAAIAGIGLAADFVAADVLETWNAECPERAEFAPLEPAETSTTAEE